MIVGTLGVLVTLAPARPRTRPHDPAIATENPSLFPWFLAAFLFVFAATGIGNGSTYRMIPVILQTQAGAAADAPARPSAAALARATKESSARASASSARSVRSAAS